MKRITFAIIGALVGFLFVFAFWAPFMGLEDSFDLLNLPGALVGAILGYVIGKEKDEKTTEEHQPPQQKMDATSKLLNYKKLLDTGVITQEEFDKKKEELLNKL